MFIIGKDKTKCPLHSNWKVMRSVMVLSSCGSSFQSLRPAPKKTLSPAQTSCTRIIECSIVPEEKSCYPQSSS